MGKEHDCHCKELKMENIQLQGKIQVMQRVLDSYTDSSKKRKEIRAAVHKERKLAGKYNYEDNDKPTQLPREAL